jgi:hypothetical protein
MCVRKFRKLNGNNSQVRTEGEMSDAQLWHPNSSMVSYLHLSYGMRRSHVTMIYSFIAAAAAVHYSAFSQTLQDEGWEVHTQLEDPTGPPLEDYPDGDGKEAELSRRLQELDESLPKKALILMTSHIGGHKYAGNVIVSIVLLCLLLTLSENGVRSVLILMRHVCIDLYAPGSWCMVRSCNDTRSRIYRAYDYPRRTDIASSITRRCQPRAARL